MTCHEASLVLCCLDDDISEEENASDDNMRDSENEQPRVPKKKLTTYDVSQPSGPTTTLSSSCSASKFFELIFSESIIGQIVAQTNIYAQANPLSPGYRKWEDVTPEMVKSFIGVVIAMAIRKYSATDDYWSTHPILGCEAIAKSWTKRKFWAFLHCFHLNDNAMALPREDPLYDKLHKVRPILNEVRRNCKANFVPGRDNSIDEAMVAYKGRSSLKQYCPLKPVKRGFKVWCLNDSRTGYMFDFMVYTGKEDSGRTHGLGAKVVKDLSENLKGKGHIIIMDNYFSSVGLFEDLLDDDIGAVATARSDRKKWPIELKKLSMRRGESKSKMVGNVHAFVWKDKKNVNFLNTAINPEEFTTVKRKMKDGQVIDVPCPSAVAFYNCNMGGVDLHDQKRKYISCSRKSQKWWPRLFYFFVDVAIVNAHVLEWLSVNHKKKRPIKEFCLELAMEYITLWACRKKPGRPRTITPPDDQEQYLHWPSDRRESRRRCSQCATEGKEKRTWYECIVCDVGLCPECFGKYHTAGSP